MTVRVDVTTGGTIAPGKEASRQLLAAREISDQDVWDAFVADAPNGHIMQGWSWGEYKRRSGWRPVRLALMRDGEIIAATQVLIRRVMGIGLSYVPRGPVCDPEDHETYVRMIQVLHDYARRDRCVFLRVEPNEGRSSNLETLLRHQGFRQAPEDMRPTQPLATFLVDMTGGQDAVQSRMKRRLREYVRSANRRLEVRTASGEADNVLFHNMMVELAGRKSVAAKPLDYYRALLEELGPRQEASLFLAEQEGTAIGGIIALAYGQEGIFSHSASHSAYHKTHVNQLLQWKAMEWCMQRGCTRYDFGGVFDFRTVDAEGRTVDLPIVPDVMEPEERGLFQYKQQFGGKLVRYMGAYDYPYMWSLYRLWRKLARIQGQGTDLLHEIQNQVRITLTQIRKMLELSRSRYQAGTRRRMETRS